MADTMQDMEQAGAAAPMMEDQQPAVREPSLAEAAKTASSADAAAEDASTPSGAEFAVARELVRWARARGAALTGPDGLLKALTKTVLETALGEETDRTPRL
jgi:2-methylisocitrate lyase-like PEP mutase family enzyme